MKDASKESLPTARGHWGGGEVSRTIKTAARSCKVGPPLSLEMLTCAGNAARWLCRCLRLVLPSLRRGFLPPSQRACKGHEGEQPNHNRCRFRYCETSARTTRRGTVKIRDKDRLSKISSLVSAISNQRVWAPAVKTGVVVVSKGIMPMRVGEGRVRVVRNYAAPKAVANLDGIATCIKLTWFAVPPP